MNKDYKCKDCNKSFNELKDNKCPHCGSSNTEKIIPVFFGMPTIADNNSCEGGICSFDKNKS